MFAFGKMVGENTITLSESAFEAGVKAWIRGTNFGGRMGVAVSAMQQLPASLYAGDLFDNNTMVILPKRPEHISATWAFCRSANFVENIRQYNQKLSVDPGYMINIPFDLDRWQAVADAAGPPPEPYSNDPTQWLFKGQPAESTDPLQVAVARLLGYRWPQQPPEHDALDALAAVEEHAEVSAVRAAVGALYREWLEAGATAL